MGRWSLPSTVDPDFVSRLLTGICSFLFFEPPKLTSKLKKEKELKLTLSPASTDTALTVSTVLPVIFQYVLFSWFSLLVTFSVARFPNCPIFTEILEKEMATHSSTLAWKIPWTKEPGRLQSMGSLIVGHNWATSLSLFTFIHWRRKWQPTPVFLPGESQGRGSLVGCCLLADVWWGQTELDTTEVT